MRGLSGSNAGTDSGHGLVGGYPLRAPRFHVGPAPGDFLVPGLGDSLGGIGRHAFQADDQPMDQFASLCGESCKACFSSSFNKAAMSFSGNSARLKS